MSDSPVKFTATIEGDWIILHRSDRPDDPHPMRAHIDRAASSCPWPPSQEWLREWAEKFERRFNQVAAERKA